MSGRTAHPWNRLFVSFGAAFLAASLASCGGGGGGSSGGGGLNIQSFLSNDDAITLGGSATLRAVFTGGMGTIDNGVGPVESGSPVQVTPAAMTTYTLTVTSPTGPSVSSSVTISVFPAAQIQSFNASPTVLAPGQTSIMTPVFSNGAGQIDQGVGAVASGAPLRITPPSTTAYTLGVTNGAGDTVSRTLTLTVTDAVNVPWARHAGGEEIDKGHAVAAYADGSCVVTGQLQGMSTFGRGEPNETTLRAGRFDDVFVARFGVDGLLAWAKRAGGSDADQGLGIASFADGSCVVTGFYSSLIATFGPGESHETRLICAGNSDIFVARYTASGQLDWARRAGGSSFDRGFGVASFEDGSCAVTGFFQGTAEFGTNEPNETTLVSPSGSPDVFIARYDADGVLRWAKRAGGDDLERAWAVAPVPDGSCVITGEFRDSAVFGAGEVGQMTLLPVLSGRSDVFVARYGADGLLQWAIQAGGYGSENGRGICAFPDGSSVVIGTFGSFGPDVTFGPGEPTETMLHSAGLTDMFIARFGADGSFVWAKRAGGIFEDEGFGIGTYYDGSCVATGMFSGTARFGEGESNETVLVSPLNSVDSFVIRLTDDGSLTWAKRGGGTGLDEGHGIAVAGDNYCVITGAFEGSATFGPGEPNETVLPADGLSDVFATRYKANGDL